VAAENTELLAGMAAAVERHRATVQPAPCRLIATAR
jgi:hypothetical protein